MLRHWWLYPDWVLLLVWTYQGESNTMVRKKDTEWKEINGYLLEAGWLKVVRETEKSFWYDITERGKQALAYEMSLYYLREIEVEDLEAVTAQYDIDLDRHGFDYEEWVKPRQDRIEVHARTLLTSWDGLIPVDADDTHPLFQAWLTSHPVPKYTHWAILSKAYQLQQEQL